MYQNLAISVTNIEKNYGEHKILDNVSMSLEKGSIYGLLGPSGCGKTTLLNCIIGRKNICKGDIRVLGKKPGGVSATRIGYMPQDVALVPEYTVRETIFYFGRIANMPDSVIERKFKELSKLLELPPDDRFIKECSGGEQRRTSLAATLVHEPELLILDEPTVGVDSLLREKVWSYFLELVNNHGLTVVVTTHYIEECKNANRVGFMRSGKILMEDSPKNVLSFYQSESLEEAFLKMCVADNVNESSMSRETRRFSNPLMDGHSVSSSVQTLDMNYKSSEELIIRKQPDKAKTCIGLSPRKLRGLLDKNIKQFYRNTIGVVLFVVLPITQTIFFTYAVGGHIKDLNLAIINEELPISECETYNRNMSAIPNIRTRECYFRNLSCRFLEYLENPMINKGGQFLLLKDRPRGSSVKAAACTRKTLWVTESLWGGFESPAPSLLKKVAVVWKVAEKVISRPRKYNHAHALKDGLPSKFASLGKVYYDDPAKAREGILHGKNVGALYIGQNFTESYQKRVYSFMSADPSVLEFSQIKVYLDMSNREVGGALKYKLIELILDFQENLYEDCMWDKRLGGMPVNIDYLHGKKGDSFLIFMIPGLLITFSFLFGATMTSHIIVSEKCEGVWDRSLAAGVTTLEITLAHLILQLILSIFQSIGPILVVIYVYGIEYNGRVAHMMIINIIQGICGLTFGFWISVLSKNHSQTHFLTNGITYPSLIMCGFMWPLEGMPYFLRIIADCLPFTIPIQALRDIIRKGTSIWDLHIIYANLIPIAWSICFLVTSLIIIRKNN